LKPGDEIVSVDGKQVDNLPDAMYLLTEKSTSTHQVVVQRNGETVGPLALNVTDAGQRPYGLSFERPIRTVYYSPGEAMGRALSSTWDVIASVPRGIGEAIAGQAQGPGVTGPVGIGQLTGEVAQESGVYGLLNLTALLGISLFMINLLPLPALDGGRLLFIFIELLRGGRRIAPEKEGMVHVAGMVVLLALMVIISFFDIKRLFDGACLLC
jgi:regulator of sigma E protease